MTQYVFSNNGITTLGSNLGDAATTLTVASGTGVSFPAPTAGEVVSLTLIASGSTTDTPNEIVYATERTGDTFTVLRGQEGTTAQAWATGSIVANMATAAFYDQQATNQAIQEQVGNFADDTGAANAGIAALSPAPANLAYLVGVPIRILKMGSSNTGAYTLNINGLGAQPVTLGTVPLTAGQLLRNQIFEVMWDGAGFELLSAPGNVSNANLAVMAANTIKGNSTGGTATPQDIDLADLIGIAQLLNVTEGAFSIPLILGGGIVELQVRFAAFTIANGGSVVSTPVVFPEPFSTVCVGLVANQSARANVSWTGSIMGYDKTTLTLEGVTITADTANTGQGHSVGSGFYLAVGY